jgi:cytochrome b
MTDSALSTTSAQQSRVWDLPVRITHWLLVLAMAGAFVTNKLGISYFRYHVWCGYTVIVLVVFRLFWGITGSYHARFMNFIRGPSTIVNYLRDELSGQHPRYAGHNPLGALMVIVLLLALLLQAISGLFGNDEILNFGPLYTYVNPEFSVAITSFHRKLFYWLLAAVVIHVLAVIAHWRFKRENLIGAMFTGRKRDVIVPVNQDASHARLWIAALIIASVSLLLWWVINHAPLATEDISELTGSTFKHKASPIRSLI